MFDTPKRPETREEKEIAARRMAKERDALKTLAYLNILAEHEKLAAAAVEKAERTGDPFDHGFAALKHQQLAFIRDKLGPDHAEHAKAMRERQAYHTARATALHEKARAEGKA